MLRFLLITLVLGGLVSNSQQQEVFNDEFEDAGDGHDVNFSDEILSDDKETRCTHFTCGQPHVLASTNFLSPKPESEVASSVENVVFSYPSSPYVVQASAFTAEIHVYNLRKRFVSNTCQKYDLQTKSLKHCILSDFWIILHPNVFVIRACSSSKVICSSV